jgi:TetR/AcrR family transcriptional regulator
LGVIERKEREKEHRREEILDAAQRVFFEKGLALATMDEIAETAELSKGTLYLYYKSKEDLYLSVMLRGMELLEKKLADVISKNDSVPETVIHLSQAFLEYFETSRDYFRMLEFLQTSQLHKQASEEMRQNCSTVNHRIWDMVSSVFHRGIRDGTVRADLNPTEVLLILWSSAAALMNRIDNEYDFWRDRFHVDLRHTVNISSNLLLQAILTQEGRRQLGDRTVA